MFDKIIENQQTHVQYQLTDLKRDRKLYAKLVEQWDYSPEIRRAVMHDKLSLSDLKKLSNSITEKGLLEAKKQFNKVIDSTIKKLGELPESAAKIHIDKLKNLK